MLYLVRGLLRGYRGAYVITMALLAASALAHPLKGGDYEEALVSVLLMAMLFGVRGAFTRRGRIPLGWQVVIAAGVGSLAFFLVTGLAAFERIPYRRDLWTTFAEHAEASRFLRAALLIAMVGLAAALKQALRPGAYLGLASAGPTRQRRNLYTPTRSLGGPAADRRRRQGRMVLGAPTGTYVGVGVVPVSQRPHGDLQRPGPRRQRRTRCAD